MALDPQMGALLAALNAQGVPDVATLTAESFRAAAASKRLAREAEPVGEVSDVEIDGPGGPLPLRIYQPRAAGPHPLLVYFHGGGFVLGDLDSHDNVCRAYCNALPAVVVAVGYRLAPEHRHPAAVDDAFTATCWAATNAARLGADPGRLVVGGDSAGGNLAAVVSQRAHAEGGPAIAHQLLLYPVCDNDLGRASYERAGTGYFLETGMMRWFWEQYLAHPSQGDSPLACPIKAGSLAGLPPATVVTGEFDPLGDEGADYARRLQAAGVAARHLHVPGAIHGFMSFIGLADVAGRTLRETAGAVAESLAAR